MISIKLPRPPATPTATTSSLHRCRLHQVQTPINSINLSKQLTTKIRAHTGLRIRTPNPSLAARLHATTNPSASSGGDGAIETKALNAREIVVRLGEALSLGFPIWVGSACLVALWRPPSFLWVGRSLQIVGLTLTMLGISCLCFN